jgi:hypothetical protein
MTNPIHILLNETYHLLDFVRNKDTDEEYHDIYCGGTNVQCININFYTNKTENIANFETLTYDKSCNSSQNLSRGEHGTVDLAKTVFNYILQTYSNIGGFMLSDFANRYCDDVSFGEALQNTHSDSVNLFSFRVAFYGKTWYEARFSAELDTRHKKMYETHLEKLTSTVVKQNITKITFPNKVILDEFIKADTLSTFFKSLKSIYNTAELCKLCSSWLDDLINTYVFDGHMHNFRGGWYIDKSKIEYRPISVKKLTSAITKNLKRTTDSYSYEVRQQLEEYARKQRSSQTGGSRKRLQQQAYFRVLNNDGSTSDIHLGTYNNYQVNLKKYIPDNNKVTLGMLIFK